MKASKQTRMQLPPPSPILLRCGVLPYRGYIGMCGSKGYGFSAFLVVNRVSSLAINKVWFLDSSFELGMFFKRSRLPFLLHFQQKTFINYVKDNCVHVTTDIKQNIAFLVRS